MYPSWWRERAVTYDGQAYMSIKPTQAFEVDGILYTPPWVRGGSTGGNGPMIGLKSDETRASWVWYPRRCPTAQALSLEMP